MKKKKNWIESFDELTKDFEFNSLESKDKARHWFKSGFKSRDSQGYEIEAKKRIDDLEECLDAIRASIANPMTTYESSVEYAYKVCQEALNDGYISDLDQEKANGLIKKEEIK